MRHPLPPIQRPLAALQAGPAVPDPEHFREIVHPIEILELVARLPREQPHVDQGEHDAPEILGAGDPPEAEHGRRQQAELVEREVAAGPGELSSAQVAARRQLALRVLERREHEQVAALVVAAVLLADPLERFLQGREIAHGRTSRLPGLRDRTSTDRATRGSSSASSSTSSSVSTGLISISFFTSSSTSTMSLWLRAGTTTVLTPARAAAVSFSLSPPLGSTRPRSVSSPVIATSWREGRWHRSNASAVAIVRSEEHTSELQSQSNLVCRLLLEKKKKHTKSDRKKTPLNSRHSPISTDICRCKQNTKTKITNTKRQC